MLMIRITLEPNKDVKRERRVIIQVTEGGAVDLWADSLPEKNVAITRGELQDLIERVTKLARYG